MKEYLKQQVEKISDNNLARCIVREYLQARVLEFFQSSGAFVNWVFVGGTALRFIYLMPRFSEDLDFSLSASGVEDNFSMLMQKAKTAFLAEDYKLAIKVKTKKTVRSAFVKFAGLLYEMGLSPLSSETVSIKVEIDSNPPAGAKLETTVIRKHCILNLQHYDKGSLLAGKLHALFMRNYVKGRDMYDLMWYLSDRAWPGPNIILLNNSLRQTGWTGPELTGANWRRHVAERIMQLDWAGVVSDVKPFIERQSDLDMLTRDNLVKLLKA